MYQAQDAPLPYGWVRQIDPKSSHEFYVDTKANPPRSIWTHPYEDEQYLKEHPEIKNKIQLGGSNASGSDTSLLGPPREHVRRHSFNGRPATPVEVPPSTQKKGLFEKMKEKASHAMEEYNEKKRRDIMMMQQQQRNYAQETSQYGAPQYAYPQSRYGLGSRRTGMGGVAIPLMGGLAGGLLLGDFLDSGGGWGGGGFGGGGFGGGGFGGF